MRIKPHPPCVTEAGSGPAFGRNGDRAFAAGSSSKAVGPRRRLQKAPCVLHRLATTCGELPAQRAEVRRKPGSEAKARQATEGGSSMEGTSGSADPGALRGASGEAALGPGWSRAAQAARPRPCRVDLRDPRKRIAALCPPGLPASRERAVRGLRGPHAFSREQGSCGGIVETTVRLRQDGSRAAPESPAGAPAVSRREVSERIGLGRSSVIGSRFRADPGATPRCDVQHDARRRAASAGRPLARETSAGAGRKLLVAPQGANGGGNPEITRIRPSTWRMGPQPHPEGFLPVQRKLDAPRRRSASRGSSDPVVVLVDCFWLQKSTRGVWSNRFIALGLATRPRARMAKGRRKPARGGKAARTVAGSR